MFELKSLTTDEIYSFLYQENENFDYEKFKLVYDDHKSRLKYFGLNGGFWHIAEETFVVMILQNKIIGVLCYIRPHSPTLSDHKHYISYISVDPQYHRQGIAKQLIQHWAHNVVDLSLGECGCSGYTQDGFDYLKPILESLPFSVQKREKEF